MPACLLALQPGQAAVDVHSNTGSVLGSPQDSGVLPPVGGFGGGGGDSGAPAAATVDPAWLSQAEGAPALPDPPLWASEQFRFFALPSQPCRGHQAPAPSGGPWPYDRGLSRGSSPSHTRSSSGALLGSSPSGGVSYLLHGSPAGLPNGFGAQYGRPGSSLSSTPPY
jgi:hypothetical protein